MRKKRKKKFQIAAVALAIVAAVVATAVLGMNLAVDSLLNQTQRSRPLSKEEALVNEEAIQQIEQHHVVNIALFGSDNEGKNSGDEETMDRSDATKIISLDMDTKTIKITSIQRDTLVWIPEPYSDFDKVNHAHWRGGPELAMKTLNTNLDLDITQYVGFSFAALEKLVDLVGGVDIELTAQEIQQKNKNLGISGDPGVYHLNGQQAMMYCRIRYIDDDFHRMDRQNKVILAIIQELKDQNLMDLLEIVNTMIPYVETNLTNDEIKSLMIRLLEFDLDNIETYQVPGENWNSIRASVSYNGYGPMYIMNSYTDLVKEVHQNIYGDENYQPSATILRIQQDITQKFDINFEEESGETE